MCTPFHWYGMYRVLGTQQKVTKFSQGVPQLWAFSGNAAGPRPDGYFSDQHPLSAGATQLQPTWTFLWCQLASEKHLSHSIGRVSRVGGGAVHKTSEFPLCLFLGIGLATVTAQRAFLHIQDSSFHHNCDIFILVVNFFLFFSNLRNTATIQDTSWMIRILLPVLVLAMGWGESYSPKY